MAKVTAPLRGEPLFDAHGMITIRFAEFLDGLEVQVNETSSALEGSSVASLGSRLAVLQSKSTSGDQLTWDETGFSWDSTKLSLDQTEA